LRALAKAYYGDPRLSDWIYQANLDTLDHPDDIFEGTELNIPVPPEPPPAAEVKVT
jgi:nucleoid-associated protein YgaU